MLKETRNKNMLYEAKNETEELGFLGNGLHTQIEAYIHRPNTMYARFDLCTHANDTLTQGRSKP